MGTADICKVRFAHPKPNLGGGKLVGRGQFEGAHQDVLGSGAEVADRVAHRHRAITAAAGEVEHQIPVDAAKFL